jgi:hypothetical protein
LLLSEGIPASARYRPKTIHQRAGSDMGYSPLLRLTADVVVFQALASLLTNWRKQWPAPENCAFSRSPCWAERDRFATHLYQSRKYRRHLRGRSPASASSAAVSRHSRLRKAWLPWRVSRFRNTASGLENERAWSRSEFRPLPVAPLPHFLPGKLRAVHPRVKTLPPGEESFAPI